MNLAKAVFLSLVLLAPLSCANSRLSLGNDHLGGDLVMILPARKMQQILIRLPKNFNAQHSYPLLLMLHGKGGTAASLYSMLAGYSDRPVIQAFPQGQYPRGLNPNGFGLSWFYETQDRNIWEVADTLSVENIIEAVKALAQRYNVGRTVVFGFSEGASLAYMAGLQNVSLIQGVAAVGGVLPEIGGPGSLLAPQDIDEAKTVSLFIARGRADNLVKKTSFEGQKEYFISKGYQVTALEYDGGHFLTPSLLARLFSWIQANGR
jgi:predicted esterase